MNTNGPVVSDILGKLKLMGRPEAVKGMARYGINPKNNYGVSVRSLREMAKELGSNHELAQDLWRSGIHDARILASIVDDPASVTEEQMETWVKDFDSWDVCDQTCNNLFSKTLLAYKKAREWSKRREEFTMRAGFVLIANLAVHDKKADNGEFIKFLDNIESGAQDERNYVRKAVNWALRQIGKRNIELNKAAIHTAMRIQKGNARSSKWIASDALRELTSARIKSYLQLQGASTSRKRS